jgi:hypothetical protein
MKTKLILLTASFLSSVALASPCGVLQFVEGEVTIGQLGQSYRNAERGSDVTCGNSIATKNGTAILSHRNGDIIIGPNSRIELITVQHANSADEVIVEGSKDSTLSSINFMYGKVRVVSFDNFHVQTASGAVKSEGWSDFYLSDSGTPPKPKLVTIQGNISYTSEETKSRSSVESGHEFFLDTDEEKTAQPSKPLTLQTRQEIRTMSFVARNDANFTSARAVTILGNPDDWNKTIEAERNERRLKLIQQREAQRKERHLKKLQGSYYEHQSDAFKWEMNYVPSLGFYDVPGAAYSAKVTNVQLAIGPEYGINNTFSIGLSVGYDLEFISTSTQGSSGGGNANGLLPPTLYLNSRFLLGGLLLKVGFDFSSPIDSTSNSAAGTSSGVSNGMTFTPFLGLEGDLGSGRIGVRFAMDAWKSTRSISVSGTSFDFTGGQMTKGVLFWEQPLRGEDLWGVDAGIVQFTGENVQVDNSSLSPTQAAAISAALQTSSLTVPQIEIYWSMKSSSDYRVTPTLGYSAMPTLGSVIRGAYISVPIRYSY